MTTSKDLPQRERQQLSHEQQEGTTNIDQCNGHTSSQSCITP